MFFFSIVIPTYNNIDKLKIALLSIKKQSVKNFETIVVDDGSTDETELFLKNYKYKNHINLKYYKIPHSGGPAKPRNIGIKFSEGKWICFLDSDDFWFSNKLDYVKSFIINDDYQIYYHKEILNNKLLKKKRIINNKEYKNNFYYNLLLNGNICSTSASIVNAEFIKKNSILFSEDKKFVSVEDYDFWLKIAFSNGKIKKINKILGTYSVHESNLTRDLLWHQKKKLNLIKYHVFKFQNIYIKKKELWLNLLKLHLLDILIIKIFIKKKLKYFLKILFFIIKNPLTFLIYLNRKKNEITSCHHNFS